ncbi:lipoprotein [Planococcus faecalis]|uniref:lipoprotein n=1 Tax=Planococcus faecalis TaxID=1598147 RepID=UPI0008D9CAE4|nr:lipoprotein [Planococcus faecalis]OHX53170.1 hypothetical protein BB777_10950 [Planococcus faecalis]
MKKIILLFVTALILSGCNTGDGTVSSDNITPEETYSFTGSNENWEVLFEVDVVNKDQGRIKLMKTVHLHLLVKTKLPKW